MTHKELICAVTETDSGRTGRSLVIVPALMILLGAVGLGLGFLIGSPAIGWTALLTSTVVISGIGAAGVLISAIFHITNARFGRVYLRMAESFAGFMPVGLLLTAVFLGFGGGVLPWMHGEHLTGGKSIWLVRGFWDVRVIGALLVSYGFAIAFLYYSIRRDLASIPAAMRKQYSGFFHSWAGRRLDHVDGLETERIRCANRLDVLAPLVAISYVLMFTLLAFDLIMALDPLWISTLFGAWYFIGNLFVTMGLLAIVSIVLRKPLQLDRWITPAHQSDLATLLFAFCLVNADFFWSQYLTIWYGNLPEETGYVITRTMAMDLPWRHLSWFSIAAFLGFPFILLLFRRVKRSDYLLSLVSCFCILGVFLARFIEIAPELMPITPPAGFEALLMPLASTVLTFIGALGAGLYLFGRILRGIPSMPIGDAIFRAIHSGEGDHS